MLSHSFGLDDSELQEHNQTCSQMNVFLRQLLGVHHLCIYKCNKNSKRRRGHCIPINGCKKAWVAHVVGENFSQINALNSILFLDKDYFHLDERRTNAITRAAPERACFL